MMQGISRNSLILAGFTLVVTVLLTLVNWLTLPRIEQQIFLKKNELLTELVPQEQFDNLLAYDCISVESEQLGANYSHTVYRARLAEQPAALIIETKTPNGYSGDIFYLTSLLRDGTIGGVRVVEHKETPGLGDKIDLRVDDWILSFTGLAASKVNYPVWAVQKDGGDFDQFTGATITPRAIVNGVKTSIQYLMENEEFLYAQPNQCAPEDATAVSDESSQVQPEVQDDGV